MRESDIYILRVEKEEFQFTPKNNFVSFEITRIKKVRNVFNFDGKEHEIEKRI
jgi:hypothetical protein